MKMKLMAAAALIAVAGSAMAKTQDLGVLTDAPTEFGNTFSSWGTTFSDTYNFTLAGVGDAYGSTTSFSFLGATSVTSVSLIGNNLTKTLTDLTPGLFSFGDLLAGSYSLIVKGTTFGTLTGYSGKIETNAVAAPVPEPETIAMMALGLGVMGFVARRRKQAGV